MWLLVLSYCTHRQKSYAVSFTLLLPIIVPGAPLQILLRRENCKTVWLSDTVDLWPESPMTPQCQSVKLFVLLGRFPPSFPSFCILRLHHYRYVAYLLNFHSLILASFILAENETNRKSKILRRNIQFFQSLFLLTYLQLNISYNNQCFIISSLGIFFLRPQAWSYFTQFLKILLWNYVILLNSFDAKFFTCVNFIHPSFAKSLYADYCIFLYVPLLPLNLVL